ncbi:MAG TPA: hypothetical protein VL945_00705 [Candidatus Saccharimonadales bacterium]|nr:hypothetical protein [Candidatus Saccharimonadales bacterium]
MPLPGPLKPEAILKSRGAASAARAYWRYSLPFAAAFLASNLAALFLLGSSVPAALEYAALGLAILLVGMPVIESTKAAIIYATYKLYGRSRSSYGQLAAMTLYSSFPMVIFFPLLAFIFINFLVHPVVSSQNLIPDLSYQLLLLSGAKSLMIPVTLVPILWKLAVCTKTLSKKQGIGLRASLAISSIGLVLVILLFGIAYSYLSITGAVR